MINDHDLKQTLIQHYSQLSSINPFELTERIKEKEWWAKETNRLKVNSQVSKAIYVIILLILISYIVSAYKFSGNFWNITIPFTTIFIFLILIRAICAVKEKVRLFAVMKLVFVEQDVKVDAFD